MCVLNFLFLAIGAFTAGAVRGLEAPNPGYSRAWSSVAPTYFPGGSVKTSSVYSFPGAPEISGSLTQLYPGGLRSFHWHDAAEWSYVIHGTCRSTVIESGANRSTETNDYGAGDIWVYGINQAHMVQGLKEGCTYISGYNNGKFEETESSSFSSWLSTANQVDAAQSMQVPIDEWKEGMQTEGTFLPLGPVPNTTLDEYRASIGAVPGHPVPYTHRFQLSHGANKTGSDGGWLKQVDSKNFPTSGVAGMSGALSKLVPQGMRKMHWHLNLNEWQFVINGTFKASVVQRPGVIGESILRAGDLGYVPRGSPHYFKNIGCTDGYIVLIVDQGIFHTTEITDIIADYPKQILATDMNTTTGFTEVFTFEYPDVLPPPPADNSTACYSHS